MITRGISWAGKLTTFMCRLSSNSWGLNLLESLGPVQAYVRTVSIFIIIDISIEFCISHIYYLDDEIGRACSTYEKEVHTDLLGKHERMST